MGNCPQDVAPLLHAITILRYPCVHRTRNVNEHMKDAAFSCSIEQTRTVHISKVLIASSDRAAIIRRTIQHLCWPWVWRCFLLVALPLSAGSGLATPYLVGAQLYASAWDGSNAGAYSGAPYQFSTNSSTSSVKLLVNGISTAIAFPLVEGDNEFTFDVPTDAFPINTIGLNLFFNLTGVSFNPSNQPGVGIPGDLAAFTNKGSATFSIPTAGTNVQSFNTSGFDVNATSYSGASSLILGGRAISIYDFTSTNTPSGSFTVRVAAVPVSGTFLLVCSGLVGAAYLHRRCARGS